MNTYDRYHLKLSRDLPDAFIFCFFRGILYDLARGIMNLLLVYNDWFQEKSPNYSLGLFSLIFKINEI